ncbi:MAG TPA: ORF6N domain-containing protein [Burkholderiales bacterium]|nr:ORF6N domain-containing protein [Burkholderiales bacterium]
MVTGITAPLEHIENRILMIRGRKVLLDFDLAALYGVETRVLNQAVKRNLERFPHDFMCRLSSKELASWRSQFVMSNPAAKMGLRRAPFAFTEHGALMAATVLNSTRAIEVSLHVVRAFVHLRNFLASNKEISRRLEEHERKLTSHDQAISGLVDALRTLMAPPESKRRPIGFVVTDEKRDQGTRKT